MTKGNTGVCCKALDNETYYHLEPYQAQGKWTSSTNEPSRIEGYKLCPCTMKYNPNENISGFAINMFLPIVEKQMLHTLKKLDNMEHGQWMPLTTWMCTIIERM